MKITSIHPPLLKSGLIVLAVSAGYTTLPLHGADISWDGATGPYTTATNWNTDTVPTATDNAIIGNGGTSQLGLGDVAGITQLQITNGVLAATDNAAITATGAFVAGSVGATGSLSLAGTSTLTNSTGGTFTFGGAPGATGVVTLNDSAQITWRDNFGDTSGGTANITLNNSSKISVTNGEAWIGNNTGTATLTVNGTSEFASSNWTVIGRQGTTPGSSGTVTLNDSAKLTKTGGGNLIVGDIGSTGALFANTASQISANGELWVGNGGSSNGTMKLSGTSTFSNNNWVAVGRGGGTGTLELSGSSSFTKTGGGNFVVAVDSGPSNGTVTVKNNASMAVNSGNLVVGQGEGAAGTRAAVLNLQDSGSLTVNGEFQIGNGSTVTTGTLNMTGGTVTASNWVAVGRNHGTGTLNLSGGTFTHTGTGAVNGTGGFTGNNFTTAGIGADAVGTINHTGGTLNNTVSVLAIGENGTVNWNASGGTANLGAVYVGFSAGSNGTLAISGTANYTAGNVFLSSNGASAGGTGTLNLNGGTLTANSIQEGAGNSGTIHFNGGTLRAGAASADFISGFESGDATIQAGGLIVDTNAFNTTITLSLSGAGGITKLGAGTLTLSGTNTYAGNTVVSAGTLSITSGFLSDTANVGLVTGAVCDLNFAGTDTVKFLFIDGVAQASGTWGSVGSGAAHESSFFTGTGQLVVAVPEPSEVSISIAGLLFLCCLYRKRFPCGAKA